MPGGIHPPLDVVFTWKPNYDDPERRPPTVQCLNLAFLALVYLVVALRVYVRGIHSKSFGADDAMIVATLVRFDHTS